MNIQKHKNFTSLVTCDLEGWENVDFASVASVFQKIKSSNIPVEFSLDKDSISVANVRTSVNTPGKLYFTPEGIMLAGYMIANFTSDETIEDLENRIEAVEAVSSGALKYVGTIGDGGVLKSVNPTEMPDAITRVSSEYLYMDTSSVGTVGHPTADSSFSSEVDYIDLVQLCEKLAEDYPYPSLPGANDVFSLRVDGAWGMKARLYIPTDGATINKVITFPYDLSVSEIMALIAVPSRQDNRQAFVYLKDNDPDTYGGQIVGHSGDFLLGNRVTILKYTTETLPITFRTLPSYADVHAGYTFIAQTNSQLIPSDASTSVMNGDMVIVNVDKTAQMGQTLSGSDFTIVHIASNQLARRNRAGLMSAEDYTRLYDVLESYGIATSAQPGIIAPGYGLVIDSGTGKTDVKIVPSFVETNNGIQLSITDGSDHNLISGGGVGPTIQTATQDRYGIIKLGTGLSVSADGVVSATANLTWA